MPTPYEDIFYKFNALVEDNELLSRLSDDEYTELLELFLSKARSVYFKSCKKDLNDVDNIIKEFNEDLSEQEQWIIATAMRYIWVERQLFKEEKLRDKIGTKYYSFHSPANLIEKLTELKKEAKRSLNEMLISYSFDSFTGFD